MCEYARKHSIGIRLKASIVSKIIKYLFQIHTKCIQNESKILSTFNQNPLTKMSHCTLHGGAFLVQRTIFLMQRAMFLRPLEEGRPQGAKKVSAPDAFGPPAAGLSGPRV